MPDCPLNTDSAAEQEASYTPACEQIRRTDAVYCGLFNNTYICVGTCGCVCFLVFVTYLTREVRTFLHNGAILVPKASKDCLRVNIWFSAKGGGAYVFCH